MDNGTDLFPEEDKNSFEAAFAWWEKRRLRYNLIVGIAGLLLTFVYGVQNLNLRSLISIVLIGVMANGCYCIGYLIEFFLKYYFRSTIDFADKRNTVFWTGTLFSVFILLVFAVLAAATTYP